MPEGKEASSVYGTFCYLMFALIVSVLVGAVVVGGTYAADQALH